MSEKVHLELSDIERVFRSVRRPAGTVKPFGGGAPYRLKVVDYEAAEDQFEFTAAGVIAKGVFPGAVKAAHMKELFEEAMLAILRHSGEVKNDQWAPHLRATMTTKVKTPSGEINFSGHIKIKRRENKSPIVRMHCEVNPNVTYEFEGRIVNNPS
ncbi:MAG: hypothetical protein FJ004_10395 [Chloroflexi bacterium]|nr:hypothetical protein [Chloroflexota bacterium]